MNVKIKIDAQNIKSSALNFNKNQSKNRKMKTAQTQCLSHFSVAEGFEPSARGFGGGFRLKLIIKFSPDL